MKVYVVNETALIYSPHEIEVTSKVFTKKEDAYKCFNNLIKEARVTAYGFDGGQGELRHDECFEMLVDEQDYEIQITIEVVNLE